MAKGRGTRGMKQGIGRRTRRGESHGEAKRKETCPTCPECQVWLASSADNHEMEVVLLGRVCDVDA